MPQRPTLLAVFHPPWSVLGPQAAVFGPLSFCSLGTPTVMSNRFPRNSQSMSASQAIPKAIPKRFPGEFQETSSDSQAIPKRSKRNTIPNRFPCHFEALDSIAISREFKPILSRCPSDVQQVPSDAQAMPKRFLSDSRAIPK